MAGGDQIEGDACVGRPGGEGVGLDRSIAQDARVGRASGEVAAAERFEDFPVELIREIGRVMCDAQLRRRLRCGSAEAPECAAQEGNPLGAFTVKVTPSTSYPRPEAESRQRSSRPRRSSPAEPSGASYSHPSVICVCSNPDTEATQTGEGI